MKPCETLSSVPAPMPEADIDTDIIFPARFLLLTGKHGLGCHAFHDKRFSADGHERPDFVLNQAPWRQARILVAGANFGCGSSRENAVWALADAGLQCVVAPSFGEIFQANCVANGLLPIVLGGDAHARVLAEALAARPFAVDLRAGMLEFVDGTRLGFRIPERQRRALLSGLDEIDLIRRDQADRIAVFEQAQRQRMPWLLEPGLVSPTRTSST